MAKKTQKLELLQEEVPEEELESQQIEEKEEVPEENMEKPEPKKEIKVTDLPGVGAATAAKLEEVGYKDLMGLAVASPGELVNAAGVTEATARKIINAARSSLDMGFQSGMELLDKRARVGKIKLPSLELNNLIGGGFETGAVTEAYGAYGSSKTQIAHQLAVNVQLPHDQGGLDGVAVFIDTENTFRPERIKQMAEAIGISAEHALKNIMVARAYNSDHQMLLAEKVEELIRDKGINVKLVIVDSLTSHFRAEFVGRGTLAERQQKLNKHMHVLAKLADTFNLAVFVTNQVMAKPDMFFGDPTEAIGGHVVAHNSAFRLYLRRGKKGTRVAKLIDSPNLPEGECAYNITEEGVRDV